MKTIRLLGILVVLILLVSTINDFIPGFIDGWNAADNIPVPGAESYTFSVHPTEDAATDSIFHETFFIYPMITLSAIFELLNYISYSQAIHELAYTGYEFSNFSLKYPWTELFIIVLLIEIFVQAVKIKEEQDLTI